MRRKIILFIAALFIFAGLTAPASAGQTKNPTADFLCEYAMQLYSAGRVEDALEQLNAALLICPNYPIARKYMKKISVEQQLQVEGGNNGGYGRPELTEGQEDLSVTKEEESPGSQDHRLSRVETAWNSLVQYKDEEIEELKSQLGKMETEKQSCDDQLDSFKAAVLEKENSQEKMASELERKDEDLNKARLGYEGRLTFLISELKAKEAAIQQLKNDKTAMRAKDEQARQTQLARVERLMKEIEDIFPDMKELKTQKAVMSHNAINTRNRQLDKIDRLMKEIEEVLPK